MSIYLTDGRSKCAPKKAVFVAFAKELQPVVASPCDSARIASSSAVIASTSAFTSASLCFSSARSFLASEICSLVCLTGSSVFRRCSYSSLEGDSILEIWAHSLRISELNMKYSEFNM